MLRDLARFADETFDALVIGGGIYGLSIAHALVERGLSVALMERRDFGGATSFNSLKTVHGGIRALQHGSLRDAREFVRERREVARLAPHLVRVLPFVVPTARHPVRNRLAMRAFLTAYDAISADRNDGLDPAVHLPASYTVGRTGALDLNPLVEPRGVTGGAVWHDYQLHSPERFALAVARTITDAGGAVANYLEALSLLVSHGRVAGVHARDEVSGRPFDVRAHATVNAAGPWAWHLLASSHLRVPADGGFSMALNLVLEKPPLARAVGGIGHGRFLFVVPWRDRSILGTSHEGFYRDPAVRPGAAEIDALRREGALAFPRADLHADQVRLVHRGLLPARARGRAHGALLKHSIVCDHRKEGVSGLVSAIGVRYTTARATARAAAAVVCDMLGRPAAAPPVSALSGAAFRGLEDYLRAHPGRERLIRRYGTHHAELPAAPEVIDPSSGVTAAEILHAIRAEMALTLADVVLRRTDLAAGGHPGAAALRAAANVMARELRWTEGQIKREIALVDEELAPFR
jgi:glycerol-3-phosphate dehydrogenase